MTGLAVERIKAGIRAATDRLGRRKSQPVPQLLMRYPHSISPCAGKLPEDYRLRTYQERDAEGWVALLNANGQLGEWNREKIQAELDGDLVEGTQFFVVAGRQIVATAGVYDRELGGEKCWEIGWVASHPEHWGRGLGRQVTAAAVGEALGLSRRPIVLRTDDFRLPALKVYLRLGFAPDYDHASYPKRWQAIFHELGEDYAVLAGGS